MDQCALRRCKQRFIATSLMQGYSFLSTPRRFERQKKIHASAHAAVQAGLGEESSPSHSSLQRHVCVVVRWEQSTYMGKQMFFLHSHRITVASPQHSTLVRKIQFATQGPYLKDFSQSGLGLAMRGAVAQQRRTMVALFSQFERIESNECSRSPSSA